MLAMVITENPASGPSTENLYVASATSNAAEVPVLTTESPRVFSHDWFAADAVTPSAPTAMAALCYLPAEVVR